MRYFLYLLLMTLFACSTPLSKRHLLVIGDSNGANKGWVYHLQELRGGGPLVNTSIGGNTFGFDGMGELRRNSLENLTAYLRKGYAEMGQIDEILISLGTNDCKAEYSDRREEVYEHLATILTRTKAFFDERGQDVPRIILVTPPAAGSDDVVSDEFQGVAACLKDLSVKIRAAAAAEGLCLVDFQAKPGKGLLKYSSDGIHFNAEGYKLLAEAVVRECY
ncbi:SGNH/GDSL hydrolase family protein [Neolewinella persica]|uniref:SGNH/GDSL hydrolase family protein n=1 Tax=Neolewinella persica TaxID=70998 RepID=UPI0004766048|nr:GDSL-type esterase/lipase family protein [Neolewinella persica]